MDEKTIRTTKGIITNKYDQRVLAINSLLCVGLDSDLNRIPDVFRHNQTPRFEFNKWIIDQTHPYASAYKMNMAFYEIQGEQGLHELRLTMHYLQAQYPDIVTICDAKRGDIGNTNRAYAVANFDDLGFDAITLHPYLGREALQPFLIRHDKACIILCRTSNAGSGELQDLYVNDEPLWQVIAHKVTDEWNVHNNCMLVVGATYPQALRHIREIAPQMTLLVPGVGSQGGDIQATVQAGLNSQGLGMIINASRSIIFSHNPADAAKSLADTINRFRF